MHLSRPILRKPGILALSLALAGLAGAAIANQPPSRGSEPRAPRPSLLDPYRGLQADRSISDHTSILGFISRYSRDLARQRGAEHPELLPLLEEIQSGAEFLQSEWVRWEQRNRGARSREWPGGVYPFGPVELDPYYRSLRAQADELRQARKLEPPELIERVTNIARDIRNKVKNCRESADGLGRQISVTARTMHGTNQVLGLEVFYAPFALLRHKGEHKRFPNLSSPATHNNIPPGFYAVWLRSGQITNSHVALDIVTDSSGRFAFELPVPTQLLNPPR